MISVTLVNQKLIIIDKETIHTVIREYHDTKYSGHHALYITCNIIRQDYFLKGMFSIIKRYLKSYATCHLNICRKDNGILQSLEIPFEVWRDISIDFLWPPKTMYALNGFTVVVDQVCVIVSRLSKMIKLSSGIAIMERKVFDQIRHFAFPSSKAPHGATRTPTTQGMVERKICKTQTISSYFELALEVYNNRKHDTSTCQVIGSKPLFQAATLDNGFQVNLEENEVSLPIISYKQRQEIILKNIEKYNNNWSSKSTKKQF
ncbi:hypothetical protein ACTFIR_012791 [Dictyostelium discoideum]